MAWSRLSRPITVAAVALTLVLSALPSRAEEGSIPRDPHSWGPFLWREDPDFYSDKLESWEVRKPNWRKRPEPRDSWTLHGVFTPDPVGILRMVGLESATSSCIGDPATPLCAVETYFACIWRRDDSLCEAAWGPYWKGPRWAQVKEDADVYDLYRVMRVYEASPGTKTLWSHDQPVTFWQEGDVVVELFLMVCRRGNPKCSSRVEPTVFTTREQPDGSWAIVSRDFYPRDRGRGLGAAKDDPDFFTWHRERSVPLPDWRNRPKPRDSRTLTGAFAPDPVGVLRVIQVVGAARSDCIGQLVTALCTVETFTACRLWHDDDLCELAWGDASARLGLESPPFDSEIALYRVASVHKVEAFGYDPGWRPDTPLESGDIILRVLRMNCLFPEESGCSSTVRPVSYVVRRLGPEKWLIIDSYLAQF